VAAVAIVLAVVLGGRGSHTPSVPAVGTLANAIPHAAEVNRLFEGVPQRGMRLGKASAPVTIVEYVDLQCPYCAQVERQVLPVLVSRYVRPGKAKLVARPLAFVGPDSVRGRDAIIAAARQDRAFNLAELLYLNQGTENTGWLGEDMVASASASIPGLRVHELLEARSSPAVATMAARFDSLANSDHVKATPTFIVGSSFGGSRTTLVAPSEASLVHAIDGLLGRG